MTGCQFQYHVEGMQKASQSIKALKSNGIYKDNNCGVNHVRNLKKKNREYSPIYIKILYSFHPHSSATARIGGRLDVQC